jgi:hypothetical protein
MNKHLNLKRALLVLFICSLSLIALFAGAYVTFPLAQGQVIAGQATAEYMGTMLNLDFTLIKESFVFLFDKTQAQNLIAVYSNAGETALMIVSILTYVFSALFLIYIVLGIVFVCKKNRSLYSIYALALLAALYSSYIIVNCGILYLIYAQNYFTVGGQLTGIGIFACVVFSLGILAFLSVIATSVLGLVYACKVEATAKEEAPEAASVAEAAGDPEAVQEGEALNAAGEDQVLPIECEPEPLPEELAEEVPEVEEGAKVQPEPKEDKQNLEINVNNQGGLDQSSLATLLREVVRDIVRDEIARNNINQPQQSQQNPAGNQTITGATFGGPLVVQYFNGGINGVSTPAPAPSPVVEQKVEKPVEEPKKEEPKPAEAPKQRQLFVKKEPVKEEPAAPNAPAVEANPQDEVKKYERLSFAERLLQSEKDIHDLYNELKNEILSYGVKSRISAVGDTFRLHKKMYVRITVAGKSLKLYFALNPADYANSTLPIQDASEKDMYQEIPLVFKVKSPLSVRRCKELIQDVMEKDGLEQGEIGKVNWIKELKAEMASGKKPEKED